MIIIIVVVQARIYKKFNFFRLSLLYKNPMKVQKKRSSQGKLKINFITMKKVGFFVFGKSRVTKIFIFLTFMRQDKGETFS